MLDAIKNMDIALLLHINREWRNAFFDSVMPHISYDALLWGVIITLLLLWALRRTGNMRGLALAAAISLVALGITDGSSTLMKKTTCRNRPYNALPGIHYYTKEWCATPPDFVPKPKGNYSFYSGHAVNSMVVASIMTSVFPPAAPIAYALIFSVGYSRVYLGKHYPSDVLGGWLAGFCVGKCFVLLYRILARRLKIPTGCRKGAAFAPSSDV